MSVNPGWGGQKFIPSCRKKIQALKNRLRRENLNIPVEVDGGIKLDNLKDLIRCGVDIVVAGSAIYADPDPSAVIGKMIEIARSCDEPKTS